MIRIACIERPVYKNNLKHCGEELQLQVFLMADISHKEQSRRHILVSNSDHAHHDVKYLSVTFPPLVSYTPGSGFPAIRLL